MVTRGRYDGGGYPGNDPPPPVSSTAAEVYLVYTSRPPRLNATTAWQDLFAAIATADLRKAVRIFAAAQAAHLRGFTGQDMRRIMYASARRITSSKKQHADSPPLSSDEQAKLSRKLFPQHGVAEGRGRDGARPNSLQPGRLETVYPEVGEMRARFPRPTNELETHTVRIDRHGRVVTVEPAALATPAVTAQTQPSATGGAGSAWDVQMVESGFAALLDEALTVVANEDRRWAARGPHDEMNDQGEWAERYTPRRYPVYSRKGAPSIVPPGATLEGHALYMAQSFHGASMVVAHGTPPQSAAAAGVGLGEGASFGSRASDAEQFGTARQLAETESREHDHAYDYTITGLAPDNDTRVAPTLPGFAFNFTVEADCEQILAYGEGKFPAQVIQGKRRNFQSVPFPLRLSSCQKALIDGPQKTRDRPFTIAELLMKLNAEAALGECLAPTGGCSTLVRYSSVATTAISPVTLTPISDSNLDGGNCSLICPIFYECVNTALADSNTSAARRREHKAACLATRSGQQCAARTPDVFNENRSAAALEIKFSTGVKQWIRSGRRGICNAYACLQCAVSQFRSYFNCAMHCARGMESFDCVDCSYTYEESHSMIQACNLPPISLRLETLLLSPSVAVFVCLLSILPGPPTAPVGGLYARWLWRLYHHRLPRSQLHVVRPRAAWLYLDGRVRSGCAWGGRDAASG